MKSTTCHGTSKKALVIPRAVFQLSGLEDAEQLTLHTEHGYIVFIRQGGTTRERLDAIRLLYDLNTGIVIRSTLGSRSASGISCKRAFEVFRTYGVEFLSMLEHCDVGLFRLGALLTREEDVGWVWPIAPWVICGWAGAASSGGAG